jgi:hypothetical protein
LILIIFVDHCYLLLSAGVMQAVLELALSDYLPHSRRRECYRLIAMMVERNAKNQMLLARYL